MGTALCVINLHKRLGHLSTFIAIIYIVKVLLHCDGTLTASLKSGS